MKNKDLLKQNLLIIGALTLCWLLLLVNDLRFDFLFSSYLIMWLISLTYLLFFLPFSYIQYKLTIKKQNIEKLNKTFRIVNWIFIFLFIAPIIYDLGYEIFFYYDLELSFPYYLYAYFLTFDASNIKDIFIWFLHTVPYLIVIILFYQSIKLNKRLKTG
jgi:hypothetical protein